MMSQELSEEERNLVIQNLCGPVIQNAFSTANGTSNYFDLYFELFTSFIPLRNKDGSRRFQSFLSTPAEFLELANTFKTYPDLTHAQIKVGMRNSYQDWAQRSGNLDDDIDRAIDSILQLNLMIDCKTPQARSKSFNVDGYRPAVWKSDETLIEFFSRAFPTAEESRSSKIAEAYNDIGMLKCWELVNRAKVVFRPTNDLREHLLYDPQGRSVYLFRHIPYLKAHLNKSQTLALDHSVEECLKMGTMPPQLLLETLHSLIFILFPAGDVKCYTHLNKLVRHGYFGNDSEVLIQLKRLVHGRHFDNSPKRMDPAIFDSDGLIRKSPEVDGELPFAVPSDFTYHYWGNRLVKLHELVNDPSPRSRNCLGQWYQRHNFNTIGFYCGVAALGFAILIGIGQMIVSILAWLHPVKA